ncbi:MAG: hypothetical protein IJ343_14885 [Clostridia bacterium]|nr:hypothetical protein [Clostridia bacterium]
MKRNRIGIWYVTAVVLAAIVYTVVLRLVKPVMDTSAWILYGFTLGAFVLLAIQLGASVRQGSGAILDTALGMIAGVYWALQFVFGGVVCMAFTGLAETPVLIAECVLLALYLGLSLMVNMAQTRNGSAPVDHRKESAILRTKLLERDVQILAEQQTDPALRRALTELAEQVHFSDATSMPELLDVDSRIEQTLAQLRMDLADPAADALATVRALSVLVKERDMTVTAFKS